MHVEIKVSELRRKLRSLNIVSDDTQKKNKTRIFNLIKNVNTVHQLVFYVSCPAFSFSYGFVDVDKPELSVYFLKQSNINHRDGFSTPVLYRPARCFYNAFSKAAIASSLFSGILL